MFFDFLRRRKKEKVMFVIAGLGNPGEKYDKTRHNIGFDVIDALAEKYGIAVKDKKFKALTGTGVIEGIRVLLVKPQTYMNNSGESIASVMNFYKLDMEENFLVVFDDISLAPGNIRVRRKGSAGGHNGVKSLIACTGTQNFMRVKVGVGEKPQDWDLVDHVLGRFSKEDRCRMEEAIADAIGAIALMVRGETDQAMNNYNAKRC